MTLETLQNEMITAWKNHDMLRKEVISSMVQAVKKAGIDGGCRDNIPELIVDAALLKELKTMQEMIDTCPAERVATLTEYGEKMAIIKEFAPMVMADPREIKEFVESLGIELTKANRGAIMKALKGKADMKVANIVVGELLN